MSIRIACPQCNDDFDVEGGLQSASCPNCHYWVHALECPMCGRSFVGEDGPPQRCPHCEQRVRFSSARPSTFDEARTVTGEPAVAASTRIQRLGPTYATSDWKSTDGRGTSRFLVTFFVVAAIVIALVGVIATVAVALHLFARHRSGGQGALALLVGLGSTALLSALCAFCAESLAMLLELVAPVKPLPIDDATRPPVVDSWSPSSRSPLPPT